MYNAGAWRKCRRCWRSVGLHWFIHQGCLTSVSGASNTPWQKTLEDACWFHRWSHEEFPFEESGGFNINDFQESSQRVYHEVRANEWDHQSPLETETAMVVGYCVWNTLLSMSILIWGSHKSHKTQSVTFIPFKALFRVGGGSCETVWVHLTEKISVKYCLHFYLHKY